MNRGNVLQTSPLQQTLAGAGSYNRRWSIMNTTTPHHNQCFTDSSSLSQLLMNGLVGDDEDDESAMTQMQKVKKLENREEQLLHDHQLHLHPHHLLHDHHLHQQKQKQASENGYSMVVKQETSLDSYGYGDDNREFRGVKLMNCSDRTIQCSNPNSSVTSLSRNTVDLSFSESTSDKADGRRHPPADHSYERNSNADIGRAIKKAKVQPSSTQVTFKARKEKLGDRITTLHQIVSPFGKTDTASVLLEAMGYIRFLQAQIQALSLPYLAGGSPNTKHHQRSRQDSQEPKKNLKSKGLCLVPISCTMQVGSDNGADYWSPANNLL